MRSRYMKTCFVAVLLMAIILSLLPCYQPHAYAASPGITQDYWNNVPGGKVEQIPLNTPPTGSRVLSSLETPNNVGDLYGSRIYGFLTPPVSGGYTFWIAADDSSELWLSPDGDPSHKEKIAYNTIYAKPREWEKAPTQKSVIVTLTAGKRYYIEALHKENTSNDNLAVAWQGPGIARQVIPGTYLTPFVIPDAPTNPVQDDTANTFGWTFVPSYEDAADYEYSKDRGRTWQTATMNPIQLDNLNYTAGQIQVRLKETSAEPAGKTLSSPALYTMTQPQQPPQTKTLLWRIGLDNQSSSEFANFSASSVETFNLPADWAARTDWHTVPKGLKLSSNGTMMISYQLDAIPEHGVQFSFRSLDAYVSVPQLAVFSNDTMAGLIQIVGLSGGNTTKKFKETYELYIPKEMLRTGANELKLSMDRGLYAGTGGDEFQWFEWDYAKLEALDTEAVEPIHGRYIRLGTALVSHVLKDRDLQTMDVTKWLGLAYSGNVIRSGQFSREWLTALRDLNLSPVLLPFGTYIKDPELATGVVPQKVKDYYNNLIADNGDLFEYLELDNEPGVFDNAFAADLALAQYVHAQKPLLNPWLKAVSPGWAYWPSKGIPDGWERNPAYRRQIEDYADFSNGHSYNLSGITIGNGSVAVETLKTYPEYQGDGFAKPMMMSETGANDFHTDNNRYDTFDHRFAAVFDRETRSTIGYLDYIMQHAAYFREYSLLQEDIEMKSADDAAAWINPSDPGETRLNIFRRLALAYSTHGKPLPYVYTNQNELAGKRAYFRAVDTSALGVSQTGAKSDKILLNFVNFETTPVTMNVNVTLPSPVPYAGERFGGGNTYASAHRAVTVDGTSGAQLSETLQPGEAVQYILTPQEHIAPSKPVLDARAVSYKTIKLSWQPASDNQEVAGYALYDHGSLLAKLPKAITRYTHQDVRPESSHQYTLIAYDNSGNESQPSDPVSLSSLTLPTSPFTTVTGGAMHAESELTELEGVTNHGTFVGMYYTQGRLNWLKPAVKANTNYVLKIKYSAAGNKKVNLVINNAQHRVLELPGTEPNVYTTVEYNVMMPADIANLVMSVVKSSDNVFAYFDWFELREGTIDETPQPLWTNVAHTSTNMYYSSASFAAGASGADLHESSTPGDYVALGFKGTGVRWYSDIESTLGKADVYIDDMLVDTVDLTTANTQGAKKVVFERTGMPLANHIIKVVVKDGRVLHRSFEFLSLERQPFTPGPDLIVTGLGTDPDAPYAGQQGVRFFVTVKNVGLLPTPAGKITGALFGLNGGSFGYTDTYNLSIPVGGTATLYTNAGGENGYWEVPNGEAIYQLSVNINDIGRFAEMDRTNNTKEIAFEVKKRSVAPPVTTATADGLTGAGTFNKQDVHVVFTAVHPTAGVGIKQTDYRTAGGIWQTVTTAQPITLSSEGVHQLEYRSIDMLNNEEEPKVLLIGIDKTAPATTSSAASGWQRTPQTVTFAVYDALSGVQNTFYSLNGGLPAVGNSVTIATYGVNTVNYYSVDAAGNQEIPHSVQVRYDPEPPLLTMSGPLTVYLTDPIVPNLIVSDPLSGVASTIVKLDGAVVPTNLNLPPLSLWLGQHTLEVTATDLAGNQIVRTFVIKVIMDLDHLDDLLRLLWQLGYFQHQDTYNSLQNKVTQLQKLLNQNQLKDPKIFEVWVQDGKLLDDASANVLRNAIQQLQQKINAHK
ncbi:PA14 domain-containing protein [Paenibacillus sp. HWE-109]|uniref:OmpL47-type beta-barrel domain-containing protein n=1 Tax=Paenibacillus sp. HWE-109 TaxID=1306526 RepID=UPI001EE0D095|nr:PA14 domain-containing protein [Paenibacillus sp. HWE-109]UKS24754.1 PA14 domain-containing protein [Paenibacillus sp. HWE-109]